MHFVDFGQPSHVMLVSYRDDACRGLRSYAWTGIDSDVQKIINERARNYQGNYIENVGLRIDRWRQYVPDIIQRVYSIIWLVGRGNKIKSWHTNLWQLPTIASCALVRRSHVLLFVIGKHSRMSNPNPHSAGQLS
jgi:hypothetical protein